MSVFTGAVQTKRPVLFCFPAVGRLGLDGKRRYLREKLISLQQNFFLYTGEPPLFPFSEPLCPDSSVFFQTHRFVRRKPLCINITGYVPRIFFAIRRKKCYQTNTFFPFLRLLCYKIKKSSMYFTYTPLVVISLAHDWAFSHGLQKTTGISM